MFGNFSSKIFDKIQKSENILINIHKHSDYDSLSSALALSYVLKLQGKKNKIISCQPVNKYFYFIKGVEKIEVIDYAMYDFKLYDLFIIPDTGSFDRVTGSRDVKLPKSMEYVVIDHHKTNYFTEKLQIVDEKAASTTEVLYRLFLDWKINIDPHLATYLLTGIMGDSVFLRYGENSKKTFKIVADLIERGADKDYISKNFFDRYEFNSIKLLGEFLNRMVRKEKFVWSAVPYEVFEKFGKPEGVREMAADLFFRGINGTDFGVAILETKKNELSLSFRSKKNTDISEIAKFFGGGGHKNAAGATVKGIFSDVVNKILIQLKNAVEK